jgi:hypothetical protein
LTRKLRLFLHVVAFFRMKCHESTVNKRMFVLRKCLSLPGKGGMLGQKKILAYKF